MRDIYAVIASRAGDVSRRSLGGGGSPGEGGAALATFEDGYDANCIVDAVLESHQRGGVWTKVTR
jgi:hypothetical protein